MKVINNHESQADFNIVVSLCILYSNKDTFVIQFTKWNSWFHWVKTENEELMGQIKTVKDENKLKENQIALLMKEAE